MVCYMGRFLFENLLKPDEAVIFKPMKLVMLSVQTHG